MRIGSKQGRSKGEARGIRHSNHERTTRTTVCEPRPRPCAVGIETRIETRIETDGKPELENIEPHKFTSGQSREKAARNGRKGGKASGKAKRSNQTDNRTDNQTGNVGRLDTMPATRAAARSAS